MTLKRLKQLVIGGAVVAGFALGAPAVAGAAAGGQPPNAGATALAAVGGSSAGAANHARDGSVPDLHLSDHEQYLRHHQRLA